MGRRCAKLLVDSVLKLVRYGHHLIFKPDFAHQHVILCRRQDMQIPTVGTSIIFESPGGQISAPRAPLPQPSAAATFSRMLTSVSPEMGLLLRAIMATRKTQMGFQPRPRIPHMNRSRSSKAAVIHMCVPRPPSCVVPHVFPSG